ncbi:type ISP restriction/modification enzyme [Allobranchiibius sp. CTAmp26]|uniref:type ISP restriction/modification enzyme n=1 Tax=Allobranchiibius sp. CTAmp26 TaxID=2815214 RepID=UPI001AA18831|nr:type ISP restriction/modification enzyme [Allobranchiibius sp. CTAmp26]MBO1756454.1 DEAD/DEAH box helicase family protein [Allobranchiibius sp. CTAmp26]
MFVEDHCANCLRQLDATINGLFCSSWCRETTGNVRYFRAISRDGRLQDPDVQQAVATRLAFLTAGGYDALGRTLSPSTRREVIDRDGGRCVSCGGPGTEIDHIANSSADPANLQLLCHTCHSAKTAAAMVPASESHRVLVTGLLNDRVRPDQPRLLADDENAWSSVWRRLKAERKQRISKRDRASVTLPPDPQAQRQTERRVQGAPTSRPGTMRPMPTSVFDVLDQLRAVSTSEADKGTRFEQLMAAFFMVDPTYADQFSKVYLWQDWPGRNGKHDTGIDLVAVDAQTGGNVAIQCKFYAPDHHVSKPDVDSFLSASGTTDFERRIIVSTGADWGAHAEAALHEQSIPVTRIGMSDLETSTIDWSQFSWSAPQDVTPRAKNITRPHQQTAIQKVTAGLAEVDRGKLIMACGTGKTFTSLRLAEEHVGAGGTVLFLVPSISLLSQTVREWSAQAQLPLQMLAVCSDAKATKRTGTASEDISAVDLALPATTNLDLLQQRWDTAVRDDQSMTVLFATYQSIGVVAAAQKGGEFDPFDLIICDEAHRTTGVTIAGQDESAFVRVHDNAFLAGTKRLYMTATPRLFGEDSKKKAKDSDAVIASMDDEDTYGPELHRLGFGEAVERKLLTDYRVLVLAVDEQYISENFQQELAGSGEIPLGDAARIVGCWNGLAKHFDTTADESDHPMRRAVAFAKDINASKKVAASFPLLVDKHIDTLELDPARAPRADGRDAGLRVECQHVDGTFNALTRNQRLDWLKAESPAGVCRVLTNARCLSEGVDVPSLDAVMFLTPRSSEVDVVQSVGRVMRTSPGKDYGYIILPIAVPSGIAPEEALRDNEKYKVVWQVLQALRAHDDRFNATVNQIDLNKHRPDKIRVIGVSGPNSQTDEDNTTSTGVQTALSFDLGLWQDGIYAKIVQKVGERRYWETWAGDVSVIAQQLTTRITGILSHPGTDTSAEFERFLDGLRGNLNEAITSDDAVEMLAQHLITRPIFQSFFGAYDFTASNPVARIMERMLDALDEHALDTETTSLDRFYASVALRLDDIDNATGRQKILVELYDRFFAKAFKRRVEKNGIVYTPIEIVDFILRSADELLRRHFGQGLTDEGVHILDGFTGTGTFIVRFLQLGLIEPKDLVRKYRHEIHANELLLLAYYIAAVNIESAYLDARRDALERRPQYESFPGLVLTDTFQSYEPGDRLDDSVFVGNNERLTRQRANPITVVVGNPPYSVGQDSANDNNVNDSYPGLDASISAAYMAGRGRGGNNSIYDSYIRAFRWATLRLRDQGVIAFVTNGGWIDSNVAAEMRKSIAAEFSTIYIYNLRGNGRTGGEAGRAEGRPVFEFGGWNTDGTERKNTSGGSRATIAITLLVRDPTHTGLARIFYAQVPDALTAGQKLKEVEKATSVMGLTTTTQITPNLHGDWLNHRQSDFMGYLPMGAKHGDDVGQTTIFGLYGRGLETGRDAWVYNSSPAKLIGNIRKTVEAFNQQVADFVTLLAARPGARSKTLVNDFIDLDPAKISWTYSLKNRLAARRLLTVEPDHVVRATYRPFNRTNAYFNRGLNHITGQMPRFFPTPGHPNHGIYQVGMGSAVPFSVLALDAVPDLHVTGAGSGGQFFARWRYEDVKVGDQTLSFDAPTTDAQVIAGYRRIDNITDAALARFVATYDRPISKDDIFHYIYGLLHSPDYRRTYAADLKRMLPRIPLVVDPTPFIAAGEQLMQLHLGYEQLEPDAIEGMHPDAPAGEAAYDFFAVQKIRLGKFPKREGQRVADTDKSSIIYNSRITLSGIPVDAYRYTIGSRSAIEWIIDRYQVKTDKKSGIVNDPNDWSREVKNPRYILDLISRIVMVSLATMKTVDELPPLAIRDDH